MNKDQIKGGLKEAAVKVQPAAGKAVGSSEHPTQGLKKQGAGQTHKTAGNTKEDAKHGPKK